MSDLIWVDNSITAEPINGYSSWWIRICDYSFCSGHSITARWRLLVNVMHLDSIYLHRRNLVIMSQVSFHYLFLTYQFNSPRSIYRRWYHKLNHLLPWKCLLLNSQVFPSILQTASLLSDIFRCLNLFDIIYNYIYITSLNYLDLKGVTSLEFVHHVLGSVNYFHGLG